MATNGTRPAEEFLNSGVVPEKDLASLKRLFELLSQTGRISNPEKFKKLEGDLWEFKSFQTRIGTFRHGRTWYLTGGFIKKRDHWPASEIQKANRIRLEQTDRITKSSKLNQGR